MALESVAWEASAVLAEWCPWHGEEVVTDARGHWERQPGTA
jgi:hypothetical protein